MAIPDYQTCMLPFLRHLADGADHTLRDTEESLAQHFRLTPAERAERLPSGQQGVFRNRVGWARTYLKKAGLLESPKRAVFRITQRGMTTLASNPERIDVKVLEQFPEFIEFRDASRSEGAATVSGELPPATTTPEESIELAHQGLREQLAALEQHFELAAS
jgi:restriction system protein